jgi:hypothetical protein
MSADTVRTKSNIVYFDQCTVKTELQPSGEYSAIDADNFDLGSPVGWGTTQLEAIADLADLMRERGLFAEAA